MFPVAKSSKKALICGAIVSERDKDEFRDHVQENATRAGKIKELEVDRLPDYFLLPELRNQNLVVLAATVVFKEAVDASKFKQEFNGTMFKKTSAMEVMIIHESLSIKVSFYF